MPANAQATDKPAPVWGPLAVLVAVSLPAAVGLAYLQRLTGVPTEAIRFTQFATAAGCLVAWAIWRGRIDLGKASRSVRWVPLILALVAAGLPVLIMQFFFDSFVEPPGRLVWASLQAPSALVVCGYLVGALAEEFAWRGFAQPMLESRVSPGAAAALTGALFGLGHVSYLSEMELLPFALFVLSAMNISVVAAAITQGLGWRGRTLVAALFHGLLNLGLLVAFGGDQGTAHPGNTTLTYAVALALGTLLPVLVTFPRLVPDPELAVARDHSKCG